MPLTMAEMVDMAVPLTSAIWGEGSELWDVPLDEPEAEYAGDPGRAAIPSGAVEDEPLEEPGRLGKASGRGVLGLTPAQRIGTRKRILRGCWLGYNHRGSIHYTQGANRWGINEHRWSSDGKYPRTVDCSAYATYLMRDSTRMYGLGDFVNGYSWNLGYTGTMTRHGSRIVRPALIGDMIFLRGTASIPGHVQVYIGKGRAFSHGSERGPLIVAWNDGTVTNMKRYIR